MNKTVAERLNKNLLKKQALKSGENWINGAIKLKCSNCYELKPIEYIFISSGRVLVVSCFECIADHHYKGDR